VRVFSLITKKQIAHIDVHGCFRTDEGAFDAVDQIALFANPSEQNSVRLINPNARPVDAAPFVTLISTIANKEPAEEAVEHADSHSAVSRHMFNILTQINFDGSHGTVNAAGGIEQAVYSRQTGLFYIAIPDNGTGSGDGFVATVDPRSGGDFGTVHTYALTAGSCPGGPTGAALGPNHALLLGCGGASAAGGQVVINDITALTTSPIPGANETILPDTSQSCDEVAYDAGSGHYGGACQAAGAPPGNFSALIDDAHTKTFDLKIPNSQASGAHSIAADAINAQFWMPKIGGDCGAGLACVAVYAGDDSDARGD
jgi:hypothetical protein